MIVDASAIVAILAREPEAEDLAARLSSAVELLTHPISLYEAVVAIARTNDITVEAARADVYEFVANADLRVMALDAVTAAEASKAFSTYGKGRHPARLNMGDCFSYAVAKLRGMPLLYKGEDFAQTDLA